MRPASRALLCLALALATAAHARASDHGAGVMQARGTLQAAFSPWDNVEKIIVDEIGQAKEQVLVQAYLLTSRKIVATLVGAHRRGVRVEVMVDAEQLETTEESRAFELAEAGIPVWLETGYRNAHNKVILIDAALPRATVITGSYNFTWSAQYRNAENVLIVRDNPELAARYAANWQRHRMDASPLTR